MVVRRGKCPAANTKITIRTMSVITKAALPLHPPTDHDVAPHRAGLQTWTPSTQPPRPQDRMRPVFTSQGLPTAARCPHSPLRLPRHLHYTHPRLPLLPHISASHRFAFTVFVSALMIQ
ncbi:hypothetical protein E2C01_014916 [Portunus trituberculatus]|uniref:Uncharacterized protein n=1 Tax=Portunus trituberculatus TaxID=210409 RepID=A0A5B7DLE5_PORTR|nr:hypothetical protein [Portunus trituberculatus]